MAWITRVAPSSDLTLVHSPGCCFDLVSSTFAFDLQMQHVLAQIAKYSVQVLLPNLRHLYRTQPRLCDERVPHWGRMDTVG